MTCTFVHRLCSCFFARMCLCWVGPSAHARLVVGLGGVGWGSCVSCPACGVSFGGYIWLNFVGRPPLFVPFWCLVQWLFFARLEHSPISRVGRGSLLLCFFGSLALWSCASQLDPGPLRFSARLAWLCGVCSGSRSSATAAHLYRSTRPSRAVSRSSCTSR